MLSLAACGGGGPGDGTTVVLRQDGREARIRVEVAATPAERQTGLMGRTTLASDAGMLFLYPDERILIFWMKDTLLPLDIAFIRGTRIVDVQEMAPCKADPCPYTTSSAPADRALEVPAGTFSRLKLGPGATASVEGNLPTPT